MARSPTRTDHFMVRCSVTVPGGTVKRLEYIICERTVHNGEKVPRTWLCYSPSTGKVYCFACKLFNGVGKLAPIWYGDWRHASQALDQHERAHTHRTNAVRFATRAASAGRIDKEMAKQTEEMQSYWCEVMKRIVSVVTFLPQRGLALRGSDETVGSPRNGNFLGILELIPQYDSFLAQHVQAHANAMN